MTMELTHIGDVGSDALTSDELVRAAEVCKRAAEVGATQQAQRVESIMRAAERCLVLLAGEAEMAASSAKSHTRHVPHPEMRTPERMELERKKRMAGTGDEAA